MRRHRLAFTGLLIASAAFSSLQALAGDLPREIAQPYGAALEKFRKVYAKTTVEGTLSCEYSNEKASQQGFVFRGDGTRVRIDVTMLSKRGLPGKKGSKDMYMATPDGSLHTYEGPGSPAFDNADEESNAKAKGKIESMCLLTYPYSFDGRSTFVEMLGQSNCKITSIEKIGPKDRPFIKINYQNTVKGKDHPVNQNSWLVVAPSEGWALREFSRTTGQPGNETIIRGSLSYGSLQDGVPLVSRVECREEQGTPRKRTLTQVVTISKFQIGDPGDYYFTAFAF